MDMHAASIIIEKRFRHEGYGFAMLLGDIFQDVFILQNVVGHFNKGRKPHINLGLSAGSDLMMLCLDGDTDFNEGKHHFAAQVLHAVRRRHWEISFFISRLVPEVWVFRPSGIPPAFNRIDEIISLVLVLIKTYIVKNEKFKLRTEIGNFGNAGAFQILLSFSAIFRGSRV